MIRGVTDSRKELSFPESGDTGCAYADGDTTGFPPAVRAELPPEPDCEAVTRRHCRFIHVFVGRLWRVGVG